MASITMRLRLVSLAVIVMVIGVAGVAVWLGILPGHVSDRQPYVLLNGRQLNCNAAASGRETCDLEADIRYTGTTPNPNSVRLQGYFDGANGRGVIYCEAPAPKLKSQETATVKCRITAPDESSYISPRRPDLAGPDAPTV